MRISEGKRHVARKGDALAGWGDFEEAPIPAGEKGDARFVRLHAIWLPGAPPPPCEEGLGVGGCGKDQCIKVYPRSNKGGRCVQNSL
jgi:hypothetical protein